jgi:hypothetical protein
MQNAPKPAARPVTAAEKKQGSAFDAQSQWRSHAGGAHRDGAKRRLFRRDHQVKFG